MIKVDSDENKLYIDGDFPQLVNECSTIVDYCAFYYVNNEYNRGVPIDEAKMKLKEFLLEAVDVVVDNVEILQYAGSEHYTS